MNANEDESSNAKEANVVEAEVAKGEQDDVLEDYPRPDKERIKKEPRPRLAPRAVVKREYDASRLIVKSVSPRLEKLARPTRHRVLVTLQERASILPPTFVDNLTRLIEAETCLTPEEAARVLRGEKRKTKKKATRLPPHVRELAKEITRKLDKVTTLDRDATLCQYLLAERFVKSILEHRCTTRGKDLREISQVILKRLTFLDEFGRSAEYGDERATQQLRLLADVTADWMVGILVEVAETRKEDLEEYCKKRRMKMMEVDDEEDDQTDSETEEWIEKMKQREKEEKEKRERREQEREERKKTERVQEKEREEKYEKNKSEERKEEEETKDEATKDEVTREEKEANREPPDEREAETGVIEEERKDEENVREKREDEEVAGAGEREAGEEE